MCVLLSVVLEVEGILGGSELLVLSLESCLGLEMEMLDSLQTFFSFHSERERERERERENEGKRLYIYDLELSGIS